MTDQCPAWSGLLATTNREKAKLTAIIQDVNMMLYNPSGQPLQARQVLQQYARYLSWREMLPSSIGNLENNGNGQVLPHVLSLLLVHLLRNTITSLTAAEFFIRIQLFIYFGHSWNVKACHMMLSTKRSGNMPKQVSSYLTSIITRNTLVAISQSSRCSLYFISAMP